MIFRLLLAQRTAQAVPQQTIPSCGPFSRWASRFRGRISFPPTFKGLPTWYTIRANKDGFTARREDAGDRGGDESRLVRAGPGLGCRWAEPFSTLTISNSRSRAADIAVYPMPVKQIVRGDPNIPSDFRDLVGNMVYVGVLAQMIGIDLDTIQAALSFHFKGKQKPIDMNFNTVKASAEWAKANLEKKDPFYLEPMNKTDDLIMTDGNTAAAIGSIFGGAQFAAWYPITPASSLAEALNDYFPLLRKREDGKHTYAVLQAEDELAAIGMAIGAGWSGLRAMTSTSGPGLSLMTEFAGSGLLCGSTDRRLGCAARRTQHGSADPHCAGRPELCQLHGSR